MRKLLVFLCGVFFFGVLASAQYTTVSAIGVTDSDGTLWADGTVSVLFQPNPAQSNLSSYKLCSSGASLSTAVLSQGPISLGTGGSFSFTVYDNSLVCPQGSQYQFTVCPDASSKCGVITLPVTGTSVNITSQIDAMLPPPRFPAVIGNYGYTDAEAILSLEPGNIYYNVNDLCYRGYSGATWACVTGNSISIPVTVAQGGTGATTASGAESNLLLGLGVIDAEQQQIPAGTGNNGIDNSLTDCLSLPYPCTILAPPIYSQTDFEPFGGAPNNWYNIFLTLGPTSYQPTASFLDERWGVPEWIFNQSKPLSNRFLAQPTIAMNNISGPGQGLSAHYPNALMLMNFAFAGGRNDSNLVAGLGDKTNLSTLSMATYHFTQTQGAGAISNMVYCYGNGDCIPNTSYSYSAGGPNTSGDEGNRTVAAYATNSPYVYQGSVSSVATAGDGSVTVTTTPSQGAGTQGEGRLAIDLSQVYNGVANSNYISSITGASNNLILTCAGTCNWDSLYGDSTQTTLTANIGNGASPVNTFPQSSAVLSVASSAGFTVGSLACIFDYDYECEKITAVGTGTVTLATLRIPHTSGAYVTTGGMAGYALELEADRVNPASLNGLTVAGDTSLLNMSRLAIPVMYNTSGNLLTLFTSGQTLPGHAGTYAGRAYTQMGSGGTVTLTVVGGVITACTASGGTGYGTSVTTYPPQLVVSGTYTTAPTAWIISTTSGGALSTCGFTPGVGVTAATVAVTPTNSYDIYPASKIYGVYNAAAGAVDGTLYTEPWPVAPSVADVVESPHYFVQTNNPLVLTSQQYIPSLANLARFGQSTTMTGVMGGNDAFSSSTTTQTPQSTSRIPQLHRGCLVLDS